MLFSYISKRKKKLDNKDLGPFIVTSVIMVGWLAHAHAASHQQDTKVWTMGLTIFRSDLDIILYGLQRTYHV